MVGVGYRESGVDFGLASSAGVERIGRQPWGIQPRDTAAGGEAIAQSTKRELLPARAPTFIPSTFHSHQPS